MKKVIILITICLFSKLYGQNALEYAQKFTISEGLAHNGVTCMLEDSRGFLWFGSYDGLNKYDGYKFTTYKNTVNSNIISSNRVRALNEDHNGNIWIGTEKGLTLYDAKSESFRQIKNINQDRFLVQNAIIRHILINQAQDIVLVSTEANGILVFNNDYKFLGKYYPGQVSNKQNIVFFKGIPLDNTKYLFSTSSGVFQFNFEDKSFVQVLEDQIGYSESIEAIGESKFIVAKQHGAVIINYRGNNNGSFTIENEFLQNYNIKALLFDVTKNLWVGAIKKGVLKITNIDDFINKKPNSIQQFDDGLGLLRTSALMETSRGNCWVATFNEGVYRFNVVIPPFKSCNVKMNYPYGLESNSVRHIAAIDDDRVYLTSTDGDLVLFNTKKEVFEPIGLKKQYAIKKKISTIYLDSKKNIWLKFEGGINLFRIKQGSTYLEEIRFESAQDKEDFATAFRSFTEDKYGHLWIGTNSDVYRIRINELNEVTKVENLNDNPYFSRKTLTRARVVYADPVYDFVWVGADSDGLFRVENKIETIDKLGITQYKANTVDEYSISSDFVSSIIRLPNEEFWIGTEGGGVCKVLNSESSPQFISYSEENGLSNNAVKSILYDDNNNLWITTNIGLNKLDTKDFRIRKFKKSDGLPFEDFFYASQKLPNGTILLSGFDGFCYFKPNDVTEKEPLPKLQFDNLRILNTAILPGDTIDDRVLLSKSLNELDEIVLKHNENVFSLEVLSLHFLNSQNHNLKYRLLPLREEWVQVPSSQNTIQYNDLQHGEYELHVMASNALNQWTPPKVLKIIVKPSIWNTNMAYTMYVLLSLLLIFIVIRGILKIQALNHKVEIEQLTISSVKKLNEAKLRFFSNISHEIKTPLTLISSPIETLLKSSGKNATLNDRLNLMKRQVRKIEQLINQVHDFQRADANHLKLNYSRFRFDMFIEELVKDFGYLARKDEKELQIERKKSKIIVAADKAKLEKIFNNLFSNALKYTKQKDTITVDYSVEDKDLIVVIEDTGQGIDEVDLPHVFERFYQSHHIKDMHNSGSGIGLSFSKRLVEMHYGYITVESNFGEGTKFTVRLPIVKEHTESEDIIEDINLPDEKEINLDASLIQEYNPLDIKISGDFAESLIFYVEDNTEMRNYVAEVLSKYFDIKTFSNGQECLDAMEDRWPDIVISDIQMPILDGLSLCIKIKSDLKTSHIPVILLTALTNIKDQVQGIRDGADAYITKPFNVQHLVTNTEALLTNRKKLRERFHVGIPLTRDNNINDRNDNAFLDKLYSIIEENLGNHEFNLNDLAREMYLNRTHFFQKVKALTNQTPFELLKMYRLKRSTDFLLQENMSVKEVALVSGFKSRTNFSKVFKDTYNTSPSIYAEEMKKKRKTEY
ncbi:two-component regulator propeller domain-containing protein [Flavivirga amylovorans]|uniref:histidine kinase n=1 Tax=Flavivirga amylovorans TaxID=870486 RepID=A0ABT8WVZ7_9FLAO|nr:hybrid sensor histidine kinase/response regulator transcription factor [Flavivirga amylovorans]MDO5985860.1 two-component regulator propeller domain-containing protein [Flavivirga amylovorans]